MEKIFKNYNYERINAVYHERGNIGCTLSHIKCLKYAKEKEYDECIIFEDDISFKKNMTLDMIEYPEIDFDIFLLCISYVMGLGFYQN